MHRRWHGISDVVWQAKQCGNRDAQKNNIRMQTCSTAWQSLVTSLHHVVKKPKLLHK
jgi:hypothetical protein